MGSLEDERIIGRIRAGVYCRVGSLEVISSATSDPSYVYCRVGSLEVSLASFSCSFNVYCRVGSLEEGTGKGRC